MLALSSIDTFVPSPMDPNAIFPVVVAALASAGAGVAYNLPRSAGSLPRMHDGGEAATHAVRLVDTGQDSHGGNLVQPPSNRSG